MKDSSIAMRLAITRIVLVASLAAWPRAALSEDIARLVTDHVGYLASDDRQGRLVGSAGIEESARYIAARFKEIGLRPAFESYYQTFSVPFSSRVEPEPYVRIGKFDFIPGDHFKVLPISGSGSFSGDILLVPDSLEASGGSLSGAVIHSIDKQAVRHRWAMRGTDGLLEWMREAAQGAERRGAEAVLFTGGSRRRPAAPMYDYRIAGDYRPVGIPVLEVLYSALDRALYTQDIDLMEELAPGARNKGFGTYPVRICSVDVEIGPGEVEVRNVAAVIPGDRRPGRYVVVGAHYDHLGYGDIASSTPWRHEIHNGADDNASGTAAVIETARLLAHGERLSCSVVLVCFTAEELGALGSEHFVRNGPFPPDSILAMINLDTIGRLGTDPLVVFGARSAEEMPEILDRVARRQGLELASREEVFGFSDQDPFVSRGIPAVHLFTGAHEDYHSPDDETDRIDFDGLAGITTFTADLVREIARAEELTPSVEDRPEEPRHGGHGGGAHLGIVPDFAHAGSGIAIKGTSPGSPAGAAGLEAGDVILALDGQPMDDLGALMGFLSESSPGRSVAISVLRGENTITLDAVLGVRSGGE
jgi:Iap family predicted aminopeptidase